MFPKLSHLARDKNAKRTKIKLTFSGLECCWLYTSDIHVQYAECKYVCVNGLGIIKILGWFVLTEYIGFPISTFKTSLFAICITVCKIVLNMEAIDKIK